MSRPLLLPALILSATAGLASGADAKTEWPAGTSPQEIGRRVVQNFLPREWMLTPQDGTIHYSQACTWYGALTFAHLADEKELTRQLIAKYDPFLEPDAAIEKITPRRAHVDWAVFSIVPLEIYLQTKNPRYLDSGLPRADRQWQPLSEADLAALKPESRVIALESTQQGLSSQTRYWIDDMYMISTLQTQAYRATGKALYMERAAREMVPYLDRLQQPNGLFFHGDVGKFYWGRGNGWMAAGMAELLRAVPKDNPHRPRILEGYRKMMAALLQHQDASGMWKQLVDHPDAWPETSSTGMFTFAFITGVREGWLDEKTYGPAARKAWLALVGYLDANGNVREVCKGMGQRPNAEGYLKAARADGDFHGQAPLLWCASAWLR